MIATILAALVAREQTGRGSYADISMYELSVLQMERALIAAQHGTAATRSGNRDASVWHQGVYPTRGVDRWIAISLFDRTDYTRLTQATGQSLPEPNDERAAFDQQLSSYTREHDDYALMQRLQAAGIAAGVVQDIEDLQGRDAGLRARPAWVTLEHAVLGLFEHQTSPQHLTRTPAQSAPAPRLGEHNRWVCKDLLGLDDAAYEALVLAGVFR
jgi:crotonobetainyl-CoA:carnitine CoA-transferase CaiB-like acyl-CoA transferase